MAKTRHLESLTRPPTPTRDRTLAVWTRGLRDGDAVAEAILALEVVQTGGAPTPEQHALLKRLGEVGLDLRDADAVAGAIVALGERQEMLRRVGRMPQLRARSAEAVVEGLLPLLEATRHAHRPGGDLARELEEVAREALTLHQQQLAPTGEALTGWWAQVEAHVLGQVVPAYTRQSAGLDHLEAGLLTGALLRSPALMGVLVALPGLLTWALPVSTPLVMICLGLIGALLVHPQWLAAATARARAIKEATRASEGRLERLGGVRGWAPEDFTVEGILGDLVPLLEGERLAGRGSPAELSLAVDRHFEALREPFLEVSGRSEAYFVHLKALCVGTLTQRYAQWSDGRERLEGLTFGQVLDRPAASGAVLALATLPFDVLASRVSPLPAAVDVILLVMIFSALGVWLPRVIPGTRPARAALCDQVAARQEDLDRLT